MKTKFTILLALAFLLNGALLSAQNAKVHGTLFDDGAPMPLQTITLKARGSILRTGLTTMDGKFEFALLDAGDYVIETTDGDLFYRFTVNLAPNETEPTRLDLTRAMVYNENGERVYTVANASIFAPVEGEVVEIFSMDPITTDIVPRNEIDRIAGPRGVESAISMAGPGFYQADQGDPMNVSGARDYGTAFYVDNVKVRGDFDVSQATINQIAFMNNGVPAAYGDLTGGVVVITTYNPGMKGSAGKPISAAERKANRTLKKRGKSEGLLAPVQVHS